MLACRTDVCSVPKTQGKKPAGQRVSCGLGNAGGGIHQLPLGRVPKTWQVSLIPGEGPATVRSLVKRLYFDVISVFQRKHIPPEDELFLCAPVEMPAQPNCIFLTSCYLCT